MGEAKRRRLLDPNYGGAPALSFRFLEPETSEHEAAIAQLERSVSHKQFLRMTRNLFYLFAERVAERAEADMNSANLLIGH
jgi:hypothetical protein